MSHMRDGIRHLEGKAVAATELESGDLLVEGWVVRFDGVDRQGENFAPGALQRGIKGLLSGAAALCFHHDHSKAIGTVLGLEEVAGKGVYLRARVDRQEPGSPLRYIYEGVRKGSYKGLSVGGFFRRGLREGGTKIVDCDLVEVSITPTPVHPRTGLVTVEAKALTQRERAAILDDVQRRVDLLSLTLDIDAIRRATQR